MTMHVNVGGVWKEIPEAYENVSGVEKEILEGYENVGGVWKQFFLSAATLNLNPHGITDDETIVPAACGISFNSNGQISYTGNTVPSPNPDTDEWVIEQTGFTDGALYQVAYTVLVSGDGPTSGAGLGSYQTLSSNRSWSLSVPGSGSAAGVWRFRVREIADPGNFVEADMTMTAFSSPI